MLRNGSGSDSSRRKKHELMRQGERGCLSGVGVGESSAPTAGPEGLLGDGVPEQNELRPHRLHRLLRSSAPDSKRDPLGMAVGMECCLSSVAPAFFCRTKANDLLYQN